MSKHPSLLSDQVYRRLLNRLRDGRVAPEQIITRRGMAEELGVSMAPVAEAFVRLEHDGLLQTLPRRGTRVRAFTPEDARNQVVVRLALETEVARTICGVPVRHCLARFISSAHLLDSRECRGVERWHAEIDFHLALAELAQSRLLHQMLEHVLRLGYYMALQAVVGLDDSRRPASRHVPLIRQLARPDPDAAARAMREHVLDGAAGRCHTTARRPTRCRNGH